MNDTNKTKLIDTAVTETSKLKENVVKESLTRLDWLHLKNHLDDVDFTEAALILFLGHLRRTSSLIITYPNKGRENKRRKFFDELNKYIHDELGPGASDLLSQELALLDRIEKGYRGILDLLDQCDISRLPSEIRIAAYISRATHEYAHVIKESYKAISERREIMLPLGALFRRENMPPLDPDACITAIVEFLTITLVMEAYKNKWFDADKCVVLPQLPAVGDDERFKAGSTVVLSYCWRLWRRTEERRRFLGGTFKVHIAPNLPHGIPEAVKHLTIYNPPEEEVFDYIANERLQERLGQTFMDMLVETDVENKATGIRNGAPLLPDAFVSTEEVHAAVSLSEILSYDIAVDKEQPCGLRLVEWLRGYAVLKQLATDRNGEKINIEELSFTIPRKELTTILERCGLNPLKANRFTDIATLKESSRDLFDCPLIKMKEGFMMVFAPALINANIARIILSTIASLGDPLARKGGAFERYILSFLKNNHLRAESFKVKREGEEYEYDVVLDWGDYIFVFECKNHSLSNHHPVQAYYFNLEIRSNAKQVIRLTEALRHYPDILRERFGIDVLTKTLVPCVLNALPYSIPGKMWGVYFTDASALKRFFQERYFHLKTFYPIDKNVKFLHRIATKSLWTSDQPSPEDFIRQFECPFQYELMRRHTELSSVSFAIGKTDAVITHEYTRTEISVESLSDMVGISSRIVRKDMEAVAKQVKRVKANIRKRRNRKTTRA